MEPNSGCYFQALQSFLDAVEGVRRQDEALNRVLSVNGNVSDEPCSELQYLLKVSISAAIQNKSVPILHHVLLVE